ncbi:MAG: glycoside hydrolase family 127 protein [Bacteroides sp.]|nr:glycoside hydrolase family 127 protein [Roseburia sp.]MCM1347336.1 glycoside hydrolase family 127 protein [Bacteroides sp.]MCM1421830.1 glycoside hydrolase family 127 protein [Bacteroides sp.]
MNRNILYATAMVALMLPCRTYAQSKLYPQHFNLEEVTLLDGPLNTAMQRNHLLLLEYDTDRLLTPFVRQSGLSDDKNSKYYGWTTSHPTFINWGDSGWSLEGHIGGHYLTALSLAYASCRDKDLKLLFKSRLDYMLDVLADCQAAYNGNTDGMEGFIGGQPINQVWTGLYSGDLAPFKKYGGWVPFYCQHKVLAGLRDAWLYSDSQKAKELFRAMSDWSVNVVKNLSEAQMQDILGWEHGGMNEVLVDAFHLLGNRSYLDAAKKYSHVYEINGMQGSEGNYSKTFLNGQHANTQVPKFIGFERIYQEEPSNNTYRVAAHNFWDDVATHRTVCIGGNSVSEHFLAEDRCGEYMTNLDGPESCNSNNMLKLSENLFDETHEARYADFYESTMWNHILATQDPETGGYVYFTSLRPQSYKIYSQVNQGMWCCVGTGMENHSKYGHFIYTHSEDNTTLYVNLFAASELSSKNFGLRQQTDFPYSQNTEITITKSGKFTLALRHPSWTAAEYCVSVNGKVIPLEVTAGTASYVYVEREWKKGDVITVSLPMEMRYEECPNYGDYIAFKYGPILLAAKTTAASAEEAARTGLEYEDLQNEYGEEGRMDHAPSSRATMRGLSSAPLLIGERDKVLDRITSVDKSKLLFAIDARSEEGSGNWQTLTLEPFFSVHHARYSCYWYQQTAENYLLSDMGQADKAEKELAERTLDFVGTGEQQSEAGHQAKYSTGSNSGSYNGEFYRDAQPGGFIEYTLANPKGETENLALMCRFTTADKGRKATIYIDEVKVADITVPDSYYTADKKGFYNIEYALPADLMTTTDGQPKQSVVFRIVASSSTLCPGLYYLRLVNGYENHGYEFKAEDWKTGDAGRVSQNNIEYGNDNSIMVKSGKGDNNVCLMLDHNHCNYNVDSHDRYLVVKGKNLSMAAGKSYLWWLNGMNRGTSVAPTTVKKAVDGEIVIAWDLSASGIDDFCKGDIYSICQGQTIFGLTSTTGTSVISYIGFLSSVEDFIEAVGIERISSCGQKDDRVAEVYSISGVKVRTRTSSVDALDGLPHGTYIVNHNKVVR